MKMKWKTILAVVVSANLFCTNVCAAAVIHPKFDQTMVQDLGQSQSVKVKDIGKTAAKGRINVVVDGKDLTANISADQKPIITKDGVTYVSIKMLESVIPGIQLEYQEANKLVKVNKDGNWMYIMLGKSKAYAGSSEKMDVKYFDDSALPAAANGRTYLPLRFAIESLGCKVLWDNNTRTLSISTTGAEPTIPEGIGKIEIGPDQYMKLMCDMVLQGKVGSIGDELGLTDTELEELTQVIKECRNQMKDELVSSMKQSIGISISNAQAEKLANAIMGALKRVNYSVVLVSKTDATAQVKVSVTGYNLNQLEGRVESKMLNKLYSGQIQSEQDIFDQFMQVFTNEFNTMKPSKDTRSITINLVNKNGMWEAENEEEAFREITMMILQG